MRIGIKQKRNIRYNRQMDQIKLKENIEQSIMENYSVNDSKDKQEIIKLQNRMQETV